MAEIASTAAELAELDDLIAAWLASSSRPTRWWTASNEARTADAIGTSA